MKNKRIIYGSILIAICMLELFNPLGGSILFHLMNEYNYGSILFHVLDECNYGRIYVLIIAMLFAIPLIIFSVGLVWQIKSGKALHCFKNIMFAALFSQLYIVTFSNYNIILSISFLMLSIAFQTESIFLEEVCLTWQSFYRKRMPILASVIVIAGVIAFPFIKYEYYKVSPYYYRVDEVGYTSMKQINYIIYGTGVLERSDSYYCRGYWGNCRIGWVFKAKKAGDVTLAVQKYNRGGGSIDKIIYTIHVDRDKKIEVTGMREVQIEKK